VGDPAPSLPGRDNPIRGDERFDSCIINWRAQSSLSIIMRENLRAERFNANRRRQGMLSDAEELLFRGGIRNYEEMENDDAGHQNRETTTTEEEATKERSRENGEGGGIEIR